MESDSSSRIPSKIAGGKYRIYNKIGSGSFGVIYQGSHDLHNESVAVKLESVRCRHPQLLYEAKIYKMLGGITGIPAIYWWGFEGNWTMIVIELLGPSLEDVFSYRSRNFSLRTVLLLGEQMLNRIEILHNYSYLHRDIKPDNFLLGSTKLLGSRHCPPLLPNGNRVANNISYWYNNPETKYNVVFMCDFGLCKRYRDAKSWNHIQWRCGKSLTGTARYCSLATHLGIEQSRRDDIEALGYVLLYLRNGSLPWQGLPAVDKKEKYLQVQQKKKGTPLEKLCEGPQSEVFIELLRYARHLFFNETPDYVYIRGLLHRAFLNEYSLTNGIIELSFEWESKLLAGDPKLMALYHLTNNVSGNGTATTTAPPQTSTNLFVDQITHPKRHYLIPYVPSQRHTPNEHALEYHESLNQRTKVAYLEVLKEGGYETDFPVELFAQDALNRPYGKCSNIASYITNPANLATNNPTPKGTEETKVAEESEQVKHHASPLAVRVTGPVLSSPAPGGSTIVVPASSDDTTDGAVYNDLHFLNSTLFKGNVLSKDAVFQPSPVCLDHIVDAYGGDTAKANKAMRLYQINEFLYPTRYKVLKENPHVLHP